MIKKLDRLRRFEMIRTLAAVGLALGIAFLLILFTSEQPLEALKAFALGPVSKFRYFGNVIELMIPLLFTGLAVSVMFSANQFNLVSEGAFFIGAIGATWIATNFTMPGGIHPFVGILLAGLIGASVALIPTILKLKWNADVLVSSLMLNYILMFLGFYFLNYHLRDPNAGDMASYKFPDSARLMDILPGTRVHTGLIVAILAVIVVYLFMYKTRWGYEIRMVGKNQNFAKYSGINVFRVILVSQVLGGFLAGLGGGIEMLGMYTRFKYKMLPGFGWDGVIVAILAKNNPALVPIGAFFLAYLRIGADIMSRTTDVSNQLVGIIQGVVIILVAAEYFMSKRKNRIIYEESMAGLGAVKEAE